MNDSVDEPLNVPVDLDAPDATRPKVLPDEGAVAAAEKPVRSRRPAARRIAADASAGGDVASPELVPTTEADGSTVQSVAIAPARRRRRPPGSAAAAEAVGSGDSSVGAAVQADDVSDAFTMPPIETDGASPTMAESPSAIEATEAQDGGETDASDLARAADAIADPAQQPSEPPMHVGELFAQVLSGAFDASAEPLPNVAAAPPKRVLAAEPEAPKLHKVLAQAGVGSRRDMEQMIADGLVTVNGQPAHTGQRISFGDRIAVDGKPVKVRIQPLPARLIAYHKPAGEVVTHDDPQQRPTVFRRLPRLQQGKWQSVGRLDLNTEGLLLFTNSGQLANQLMHPRFGVEREYAVRLLGRVDPQTAATLLEGVEIDSQKCSFRSIDDGGGDGANHWYRVVITEGRNREVRRLFEAVGLTVSRLIRIRYGSVVLPRGLKRGVWVDLSDADLRTVRQLVSAGQRPQGDEARAGSGERSPANDRPPRPGQEPRPRRDGREPRPQHAQPPARGNGGNAGNGNNGGHGGNGPRQPQAQRPVPVSFDHVDRPRTFDPDVDPDFEEEIDHARIPNPLEQTFDKRFVQNPRGPAGGRGFGQGGGGFGAGGSAPRGNGGPGAARKAPGAPREPDPMQTSVGYIGGDAFLRRNNRGNGGGGGGGNGGGGGVGGGNRGGGPRGGNGGQRGGGGYRGR